MVKLMEKVLQRIHSVPPDFRANPLHAVARRLLWQFHWVIRPNEPIILIDWYKGMSIALPRSGSAAQVFYRRHSNAEIVKIMEKILKPGDIVVDIGAHIGEYTLIAAYLVKPSGMVYAIEPQPECVNYIRQNCEINGLKKMYKVYQLAAGDLSGSVSFKRDPHSWGGLVVSDGGNLSVQCVRLDDFAEREGLKNIAFIKIDAA